MLVVSSLAELENSSCRRISVACGNFDGLHLGHQAIFKKLLAVAKESGSAPVILTFSPHPREVLSGVKITNLSSPENRYNFLDDLGITALVIVNFTKEFANQEPDEFLRQIMLGNKLSIVNLCVGANWQFGKNRRGDVNFLRQPHWGWQVHAVEEIQDQHDVISSSRIRQALSEGNFTAAEKLLGRPYSVTGKVIHGKGLATSALNFPTANIEIKNLCLPLSGVYIVKVKAAGNLYYGLANIGTAPTFSEAEYSPVSLEVHLLNFTGDLYHQSLEIIFVSFLRAEEKFSSPLKLQQQIKQDVISARKHFNLL